MRPTPVVEKISMSLFLGIDIGTSSVKAVVFDGDHVLAVSAQEYPIHNPAPERAEQNADDWWQATIAVVSKITAELSEISAIGLTGQMHGTVLLDQNHKPLHPAIIWADQRTGEQVQKMTDALGAESFARIAGTLPAAGFMGPTLLWLAEHHPDLLDKTAAVLLPKDYVRMRLTGEVATDISDAAGTALFDVTDKKWSHEILDSVGIPARILPPVLDSWAVAGQLTRAAADALGLKPGIPVVAGCADQPAQAIANGLTAPGKASVTLGTGGQVLSPIHIAPGERVPTDPRVHVFNHAVPEMWYSLGAILAAGLSLRWLRNLVGLANTSGAYEILSQEAAQVPVGADGLIFLPYLVGERTPHMDPLARGGFIGLRYHHSRGHMARAVMEGVAFALRQTLEISLSLSTPAAMIVAAGGGAESDVWRQIQADVYGLPLQRTVLKEQTCIGAAVLAGQGTHLYSHNIARYGAVTEPDAAQHSRYNGFYEQFLGLYPRLRADLHQLSER